MSLTATLAQHAATAPYAALPPAAVQAAKRSLLDAVGVMLGASGLGEGCAAFAEQARQIGGRAESTVLGFGFKAPALMAAFANGATAHALDFEDAYDGAPIHPNAAVVPAALAIAEARGCISGETLIGAIAVGCDLVCRLGLSLRTNPDVFGFYPPPILSAFGAAAAAGRLLGLDAVRMEDAFALTLSQAVATAQFKETPDSMLRAVRDAFATQAGVQAAQLAARGVRGFAGAFEGKAGLFALYARGDYDPQVLTEELGEHFLGAEVSFKPWPACRGTHAFIEAAEALGVAADEVAHMTFTASPMMAMLAEPRAQKIAPSTAIDAKFSLPFTVATQLVQGEVTLASFTPAAMADEQVLSLAARSTFVADPNAKGPDAMTSGELALDLADGRRLTRRIERPRGAPSNPMSNLDLAAKFLDCAGQARVPAKPERLQRFIAEVARLETLSETRGLIEAL